MTTNNCRKILIFSIFSLLLFDVVFVSSTENTDISLTIEYPSYETGDVINVTGKINSNIYDSTPIILRIIDNTDNIITVDQFTPSRDGIFQKSYLISGPLWKSSGEYFIIVNYDTHKNQTSFSLNNNENNYTLTFQNLSPNQLTPDDPNQLTPDDPNQLTLEESMVCGPGTIEKDGMCIPEVDKEPIGGGGCLIATAAYDDSELSSQIQSLRHIRDNILLNTKSGQTFMQVFNSFYYSFSPYIADLERENQILKQAVKITITPLLYTFSILDTEINSENEMIFYGLIVISLNMLIYFILPFTVFNKIKYLLNHK